MILVIGVCIIFCITGQFLIVLGRIDDLERRLINMQKDKENHL